MSFCPKCGTQIADGTAFCPNCGYRLNDSQSMSSSPSSSTSNNGCKTCPDNYLVYSILTTLFCCLPFGIVGIVKSAQVSLSIRAVIMRGPCKQVGMRKSGV